MKIVHISDTHGCGLPLIPKCDVLVHSGDMSSCCTFDDFRKFVRSIIALQENETIKQFILIPGNHDKFIYENLDFCKKHLAFYGDSMKILVDEFFRYEVKYNHKDIEVIGFYGSTWTHKFGSWFFMKTRKEIWDYWHDEKLAAKTSEFIEYDDVLNPRTFFLVTHGPTARILDGPPSNRIGEEGVQQYLDRFYPEFHFHGHNHSDRGIKINPENHYTIHLNGSCLNEQYKRYGGARIINTKKNSIIDCNWEGKITATYAYIHGSITDVSEIIDTTEEGE